METASSQVIEHYPKQILAFDRENARGAVTPFSTSDTRTADREARLHAGTSCPGFCLEP